MKQIYNSKQKDTVIHEELVEQVKYIKKNQIGTYSTMKYDEVQELSLIECKNSVIVYFRRFDTVGDYDFRNKENIYLMTDIVEFTDKQELVDQLEYWGRPIVYFNGRAKEIIDSIS